MKSALKIYEPDMKLLADKMNSNLVPRVFSIWQPPKREDPGDDVD